MLKTYIGAPVGKVFSVLAVASISFLTISCGTTLVPESATPNADYGSLLFKRSVYAKDLVGQLFTVTAGTELFSDRKQDGVTIYCGTIIYEMNPQHRCVSFDGKTLVINDGIEWRKVPVEVSPGTIEVRPPSKPALGSTVRPS